MLEDDQIEPDEVVKQNHESNDHEQEKPSRKRRMHSEEQDKEKSVRSEKEKSVRSEKEKSARVDIEKSVRSEKASSKNEMPPPDRQESKPNEYSGKYQGNQN